jgi:YD repeat-containing protein
MMRRRTFRVGGMAALATLFLAAAQGQTSFRYFYDANGQLFRVLDSSGNLVEYDYDAAGNPTQIVRSALPSGSLAILNLVPARGNAGATVTIFGQNFSANAAGDTVMFNGVAATVISASATALVVQAPGGVTSGPVSVTVNGTTVTSGTLNFTVPNLPTITSISPAIGYIGESLTVNVLGANLTGATFEFLGTGGIGITNVSLVGSTQASFTASVGQSAGEFVLVPTGTNGPGTSVASVANLFRVYEPPGDNYTSVRLSVFNTNFPAGVNPSVPAGSNFAGQTLSVFNTSIPDGVEPGVPAGSHAAAQAFSTFNTSIPDGVEPGIPAGSHAAAQAFSTFNANIPDGVEPGVPAGSNAATQTLSVFNTKLPVGANPFVPAGSNTAFELFAADNTDAGAPLVPQIFIQSARAPGLTASGAAAGAGGAAETSALRAGQTVPIAINSPAGFLPNLQFRVNGAVLAASTSGALNTYFTVPYGVASLTLQATGQTAYGAEADSTPQEISVVADTGRAIGGRVVDANGLARGSATVSWQANGLAAEYYQFNQQLSAIPDLSGLQPARTAYVSALNFPNPQQVFGADPLGAGLGQSYAARFHGKLSAAVAGDYQFQLGAHLGARLSIDGQVVDASGSSAGTALTAGEHDLEVIYYDSGGAAAVQLLWTPPGGAPGVVSPEALLTGASAVTGSDGRFQVIVPSVLGGVQVSAAQGTDAVVLDQ